MLFKNEDTSLKLDVVRYEFMEGEGQKGSDDQNWLVMRCTWINDEGNLVKDSNACLLTYELKEMTAGLKVLHAGIRESYESASRWLLRATARAHLMWPCPFTCPTPWTAMTPLRWSAPCLPLR